MPADHLTNPPDQIFKLGQTCEVKRFFFFVNTDKHRLRPARPQVKSTGLSINQFRTLATTAESGSCSMLYGCSLQQCYMQHRVLIALWVEDAHIVIQIFWCGLFSISWWPNQSLIQVTEDTSGKFAMIFSERRKHLFQVQYQNKFLMKLYTASAGGCPSTHVNLSTEVQL